MKKTDKQADTSSLLSADVRERIDQWIKRYPAGKQASGVFEALRLAQEQNKGLLTVELMDAVADYLDMPPIAVYEVATFYTMYRRERLGQHVIEVCTNISCMLSGVDKIVDHFRERLGIDFNETTSDGKFTLKEVECLGACVAAPVCQVGKQYHESLTPESIDDLLARLNHGK